MKKTWIYPALALMLGVSGAALRRWQIASDFDRQSLPVPGQATLLLLVLTAAAVVGCALLVLPLRGAGDWESTLGEKPLPPLGAGAALYGAAAVLLVLSRSAEADTLMVFELTTKVIPVLTILTAAAAAVGLLLAAPGGARRGEYLVLPAVFGCFWMERSYHSHGSDPVVLHYVWYLLAVVLGALVWYHLTALSFGRGSARRTLYLCLLAVFFSLTALADGESLANQLLLVANALSFLALSLPLAEGLSSRGRRAKVQ